MGRSGFCTCRCGVFLCSLCVLCVCVVECGGRGCECLCACWLGGVYGSGLLVLGHSIVMPWCLGPTS